MNLAIRTPRVYILLPRRLRRTKMTPNKRPQNIMSRILHNTAIHGMRLMPRSGISPTSIVPVRDPKVLVLPLLELEVVAHLAEVPESEDLVFAVGDDVSAVAFG